ncbi:MAG: TIGR02391 family protein [Gammaproteobacteria bacterium]|nr:TIGR02391 family protein [Gammaproteobacteria bacterium]
MNKQWKAEEELNEAIRMLMYRIDSLQAKSVTKDIESDSVNIEVQEMAFRNTIREVFGADSQEFAEFGNTQMLRSPLRVGISNSEIVQARLRGREYMVQICAELITRLQQKILEVRRKIESGTFHLSPPKVLHPIIDQATRDLIINGHHWEAVFAASKALVLYIKERSGRRDLDGVPLMRTVFSKNNPILKFNSLTTQIDLDEQEGMMHLYEGAVMALRNPGSHGFPTGSDLRASQYIYLLSLLMFRADEAIT